MKILIVEDSDVIVETVSLCLQVVWPDIEITTKAEGSQGVQQVKNADYDLVILDVNLPDIDGFKVLEQIRVFSKIPVVMLTVRIGEADKSRGFALGSNGYIGKPYKSKALIEEIKKVLNASKAEKPALSSK